ncbi:hypothetical protein JOC55_005779 [Paenibacillus sacheonensis]|nr:hypothetical protein [Paenibacillus sacheonensis]
MGNRFHRNGNVRFKWKQGEYKPNSLDFLSYRGQLSYNSI